MEQNVNFTSDFPQIELHVIKEEVQFEESNEHYENIEEYHGVKPKEELCDIEFLDITSSVKQEEITAEHEDELRRNEFDDKKDNIVPSNDSIKTEKADCQESSEKCDTENDVGQMTSKIKNELTEEIDNDYLDMPSLIRYEDINIKDEVVQNRNETKEIPDDYLDVPSLIEHDEISVKDEAEQDRPHEKYQKCDLPHCDQFHLTRQEASKYNCNHCDFKSLTKSELKLHWLKHEKTQNQIIHKCVQCNYETKLKSDLLQHYVTHQKPEKEIVYKCEQCDYQANNKRNLLAHYHTHKAAETYSYQCDQCDYGTFRKKDFSKHALFHKRSEKVNELKCDQCDYQTYSKRNLNSHVAIHKIPIATTYKCDRCYYQTKWKGNLKRHKDSHKKPEELNKLKVV